MLAQSNFIAYRAGLKYDRCENVLPVVWIRDADRGGFKHCGMREQCFIDFARRYVLATFNDQFFDATGDEIEAVRVTVS